MACGRCTAFGVQIDKICDLCAGRAKKFCLGLLYGGYAEKTDGTENGAFGRAVNRGIDKARSISSAG